MAMREIGPREQRREVTGVGDRANASHVACSSAPRASWFIAQELNSVPLEYGTRCSLPKVTGVGSRAALKVALRGEEGVLEGLRVRAVWMLGVASSFCETAATAAMKRHHRVRQLVLKRAPVTLVAVVALLFGCSGSDDGAEESFEPACKVWNVTYDLTGSHFEISGTIGGLGDQRNTCQEPYDAGDTIGPGTLVLRFGDDGGNPAEGDAAILSYEMDTYFVVETENIITVTTDIEVSAGPELCGVANGALKGSVITWTPALMRDYRSRGNVHCDGSASFCQGGGLEPGDNAEESNIDLALHDFVFSNGLSTFEMEATEIPGNASSTTTLYWTGTEIRRELVDAPACDCGTGAQNAGAGAG